MIFMMIKFENMFFFLMIMFMFIISHIESLILIRKDMESVCKDWELGRSINETIENLREQVAVGGFSKLFFEQDLERVEKVIRIIHNDLGNVTNVEKRSDMAGCSDSDHGMGLSLMFAPEMKFKLPFAIATTMGDATAGSSYSYSYSNSKDEKSDSDLEITIKEKYNVLERLFRWMKNTFPVPCRLLQFPLFLNTNKPHEMRDLFIDLALQRQAIGINYLRREKMTRMGDDFSCMIGS